MIRVPRSPYSWCPDCEGAGVMPDANGSLTACRRCGGQGRLKVADPFVVAEDLPPPPDPAPEQRAPMSGVQEANGHPILPVEADPDRPDLDRPGLGQPGMDAPEIVLDVVAVARATAWTFPGRDTPRPSPDDYFMGFAAHAATRSKDSTKVGAVLVGPDGEVRLTGYNGPPKGVRDTPDRFERPRKYLFSSHAEQNVIAFAARQGIRTAGCTLYVTHHPCSACARSIIQAGIVCVVVGGAGFEGEWLQEIEAAQLMFADAGVKLRD